MFLERADGEGLLSSTIAVGISVSFWLALGTGGALFAAGMLAPKISESGRLHQRYFRNLAEEATLKGEIGHFSNVVHALETDPDFLARVAETELESVPPGGATLRVDDRLGYDARVPQRESERAILPPAPGYLPFFERLSEPSPLRTRWMIATAALVVIAFTCLNEGFFASSPGRLLLSLLLALAGRWRKRVEPGRP